MSNKERVEGEFVKPIIYGNRAYRLPEKIGQHTHRWTVYVRSYNNEKLSNYVRKVQFKIHNDYKNPIQIVEQEPFELTETGWGEFTVQIKLYFIDPQERQVTCTHYLALHTPEYPDGKGGTYVMKENYDEIIFVNPLKKVYDVITNDELVDHDNPTPWQFDHTIKEDEEFLEGLAKQSDKEVEELINAIKQIAEKNQEYREKIKEIDGNQDTGEDESGDA
jgi:YEATS domain-containing protein 4|uniref:Protein AF-9 homolog n=1 Tax=Panagrolaimus sp. PS1159 TaxID=55785 RepID=A0AC35F9I6_9BILA